MGVSQKRPWQAPVSLTTMRRGKWPNIDRVAHSKIAGVVGMEIIPRQLGERAVRKELRQHVAGRRVERRRVKILYAVIQSGTADESVENHATGVMPWAVVAHINTADAQRRGQGCAVDFNALGV